MPTFENQITLLYTNDIQDNLQVPKYAKMSPCCRSIPFQIVNNRTENNIRMERESGEKDFAYMKNKKYKKGLKF